MIYTMIGILFDSRFLIIVFCDQWSVYSWCPKYVRLDRRFIVQI